VPDFDDADFVKICGVISLGDANAAIDAGASAIGLNLATSSRHLSLDRALAIAEATRGRILRTLIFYDNDDEFIVDAVDRIDPDAVQIHGPLSDELLVGLRQRDVRIVKALSIGTDEFFGFNDANVDAVMVDGATPGSGVRHSWDDLFERTFVVPVIAAGGLDDANVAGVIGATGVWGVDSASGVESSPGIKDRDRMRRFVANARHAFQVRSAP
jgi:phosphoribosylanthranilate isomerase